MDPQKMQQNRAKVEPKAAPGSGIRSLDSTTIFRIANFELFVKPVIFFGNSFLTLFNVFIPLTEQICYGLWIDDNDRRMRLSLLHEFGRKKQSGKETLHSDQ